MAATGVLVAIEGPSGAGKSSVTRALVELLSKRGVVVAETREPSDSAIGSLARTRTHEYRGMTLACLVAADRYNHLEQCIGPDLAAGCVVVCDRYVMSSLVLQGMDGVESEFIWAINSSAPSPDLTVVLQGSPELFEQRAAVRGTYSRFHGRDAVDEARRYREASEVLAERGWTLMTIDVEQTLQPTDVASRIVPNILGILSRRSGR